ncbi:molybdopterin synthase [Haloquadratum walsbyi]|jgi:molybdopterin synthase subunit MoaE/molybdopterin guanine dinucleotide biosynthesis accessory protein MobB|uniref:Molybdopterin converting factor, large subunit n=1 Tax=Haloquadratum walsbyi J07HQW2 TaxID=1238425 RepID=U1NG57_9EURY|nr:molybdopterin synthase [Haloquadratum walsbyi]ERG96100.1 MAG: molybdopterin converting factor, large subunit [Haloquadratum walsbyi J07HQW2]
MQVLGILGRDAGALCSDVVAQLDGTVAVIQTQQTTDQISTGAQTISPDVTTQYDLTNDGRWHANGENRNISDILDELSTTVDYTLVIGASSARIPTVALDTAVTDSNFGSESNHVVLSGESAATVDVSEVVAAVETAEPYITLSTLVERVKASSEAGRAGAIATFTGRVRARDDDDDPKTVSLRFETYDSVADDRMREIESELIERDGVFAVELFHKTGVINNGEDIVFVVVLAGHRQEAFETVSDGINRLKAEVPIFKHETTVEEDFWVHKRD